MKLFICVFLMMFTVGLSGLSTQDIWVNPGESIQAKIDMAQPGSTLWLAEGTWNENLVITKPLTLRGQGPGRTIIRARQEGREFFSAVVLICGPLDDLPIFVVIEGLTLIGEPEYSAVGVTSNSGFLVYGMVYVVVHNCQIRNTLDGIKLVGGGQAFVSASHIEGEKMPFGGKYPYQGIGIYLMGRSQAFIERTTIRQVGNGIVVEDTAQATVHRSTIEYTAMGVTIGDDGQVIVIYTEIKNSEDGVMVFGRGHVKIISCMLANNKIGIALADHASAVLIDNVITRSHTYGVMLPIHHPRFWFAAFVVGGGNVIPGPDEPNGNCLGAVFPAELAFLMTKEGGVYPKR